MLEWGSSQIQALLELNFLFGNVCLKSWKERRAMNLTSFKTIFLVSSLVEDVYTFYFRNFASKYSLRKLSCLNTHEFWEVLFVMAKLSCLSVGKWLYGCILIQQNYAVQILLQNLLYQHKWISQIKWSWKERERKKKQVAEVFILCEWFTFSFGDMKNYDICYLGMHTDGVKV